VTINVVPIVDRTMMSPKTHPKNTVGNISMGMSPNAASAPTPKTPETVLARLAHMDLWSAEQKNNGNVPQVYGENKIVVPRAGLEPATSGDISRRPNLKLAIQN
jgi:hypothetical protein